MSVWCVQRCNYSPAVEVRVCAIDKFAEDARLVEQAFPFVIHVILSQLGDRTTYSLLQIFQRDILIKGGIGQRDKRADSRSHPRICESTLAHVLNDEAYLRWEWKVFAEHQMSELSQISLDYQRLRSLDVEPARAECFHDVIEMIVEVFQSSVLRTA